MEQTRQFTLDVNAVTGFIVANLSTFILILQIVHIIVSIIDTIRPRIIVVSPWEVKT